MITLNYKQLKRLKNMTKYYLSGYKQKLQQIRRQKIKDFIFEVLVILSFLIAGFWAGTGTFPY